MVFVQLHERRAPAIPGVDCSVSPLPFLRIARAMCYLCMGRVLDWERLHKIFSDEFCEIFTGRTAEAPPGPVDHLAKFHSIC